VDRRRRETAQRRLLRTFAGADENAMRPGTLAAAFDEGPFRGTSD
jgi:hypothetical protein